MTKRKLTFGAAGVLLIVYLLTGLYTVASDEMAVVTFFGKVVQDRVPAGIHYRLPPPFTEVKKPKVKVIKRMSVGFKLLDKAQGISPSRDERERLTGDANVITVGMMVQYTVRDPASYLFNTESPDFLVRKAGEALLCKKIGMISVDDLLTVGKAEVELYLRQGLQAFMDSVGAGLSIRSCNLQRVEPPAEVIESFNDVARARANREKSINEAHAYRSEILPRARAQAQQIVQEAQAEAAARISRAEGELARFEKVLSEYRRNPGILKQRMYWETVQQILANARKIIVEEGKDGRGTTLRIVTTPP